MRRTLVFLLVAFASPLALRADDAAQKDRLSALALELRKPDGMRAAFKLVDAGPAAVPDLVARLGSSPLADERIEACLREIARTKEGARVEIERLSLSSNPLVRARLARALAAAKAPEAIYPIVDALDAQEPLEVSTFGPGGGAAREVEKIRKPVSTALATFGDRAVNALRKRLASATSSDLRAESAQVLGMLKAVAAIPDLVAIAQDENRRNDERAAALTALGSIGTPAAKAPFANALGSDSASVRRAAARAIAQLPDPSSLPLLARLLDEEKDDEARLDYAKALAAFEGDPLTLDPLKTALERTPKLPEIARTPLAMTCIRGIAATGDHAAPSALVSVLDMNLGFHVEHAAASALTKIADLGHVARERLREIVEQKSVTVPRACAAWVLAQRGEDASLALLIESARSKEWAVRVAVATLLGEGKLDGAVPVLATLAKDAQANVRRAAVFALGRSEDSHAGAALVAAALHLDPDPTVRRLYAAAFAEALTQVTLDRDAWKPSRALLVEALEHEFPDATLEERRAQAFSLARLGDRPALLRIATGALASNELPTDSRRAAIEALARLGRHDATEQALEGAIRDPKVGDDAAIAVARMRGETFFESQWRALLAPPLPFH